MLKELALIGIVVLAGIGVSRLWVSGRQAWSLALCVLVALIVVWLARRWHIDLSGVA